jgi:hypothetical protein
MTSKLYPIVGLLRKNLSGMAWEGMGASVCMRQLELG